MTTGIDAALGVFLLPVCGLLWAWGRRLSEEAFLREARALCEMMRARDGAVDRHTGRVRQYAEIIAKTMGAPPGELARIGWAGKLHDFGKIFLRREVLSKAQLTREEFEHLKQHVHLDQFIASLPRNSKRLIRVLQLARLHHERFDGKGYPFGLKGREIPLEARVIAVADAWDAMTTRRVYRKEFSWGKAMKILIEGKGIYWDPEVVDAFVRAYEKKLIQPVFCAYRRWLRMKNAETLRRIQLVFASAA